MSDSVKGAASEQKLVVSDIQSITSMNELAQPDASGSEQVSDISEEILGLAEFL
ncbi:MAG: hypothetical protein SVZ03_02235 [Spirochaetota bacterium]|nr:hypothetical protein [Spirochaetota bacterium]